MATPTVKSTYALDLQTVRALERLAKRWAVSKSEALRRAIRAASADAGGRNDALEAWHALQRSMKLTPSRAAAWTRQVRSERRASSLRRLGRDK